MDVGYGHAAVDHFTGHIVLSDENLKNNRYENTIVDSIVLPVDLLYILYHYAHK